jgi:hypothetical protein
MWLSWYHSGKGSRRQPGFPSWSSLGWADAPIRWKEDSHFTGAVSARTPAGVEDLFHHLLCGGRDPNEMPQLHSCYMKTAQRVKVNPKFGGFLLISIGKGYYIRGRVYWDDKFFTTNESLKIAFIGETELGMVALLLIAVSDHYERIGFSETSRGLLNDPRLYLELLIKNY